MWFKGLKAAEQLLKEGVSINNVESLLLYRFCSKEWTRGVRDYIAYYKERADVITRGN